MRKDPETGKEIYVFPAMAEGMELMNTFFAEHSDPGPFGDPGPNLSDGQDVDDPEFGPDEN